MYVILTGKCFMRLNYQYTSKESVKAFKSNKVANNLFKYAGMIIDDS